MTARRRTMQAAAPLLLIWLCARPCHAFVAPSPHRPASASPAALATCRATEKDAQDGEGDFEWDGDVIEGAHDDDYADLDDAPAFVPSAGFMSMASSVASPALATAAGGSTAGFDPLQNMGQLHRMELAQSERGGATSAADLEEMGGDPAFLGAGDLEEMGGDPAFLDLEEMGGDPAFLGGAEDDAAFFWDGQVDEEAHMD